MASAQYLPGGLSPHPPFLTPPAPLSSARGVDPRRGAEDTAAAVPDLMQAPAAADPRLLRAEAGAHRTSAPPPAAAKPGEKRKATSEPEATVASVAPALRHPAAAARVQPPTPMRPPAATPPPPLPSANRPTPPLAHPNLLASDPVQSLISPAAAAPLPTATPSDAAAATAAPHAAVSTRGLFSPVRPMSSLAAAGDQLPQNATAGIYVAAAAAPHLVPHLAANSRPCPAAAAPSSTTNPLLLDLPSRRQQPSSSSSVLRRRLSGDGSGATADAAARRRLSADGGGGGSAADAAADQRRRNSGDGGRGGVSAADAEGGSPVAMAVQEPMEVPRHLEAACREVGGHSGWSAMARV